jgi:site-specific recombinase XerD
MYYNKTRDLTGLADLLGHSSINVTRIYTADPQQKYLDTLRDIYRDTLPEKK